jgi:hypothetical protein
MLDRLSVRGDSWGEFIKLLAHFRVDEEERKAKEKQKAMRPILPPPHAVPKGDRKKQKEPRPEATTDARHDLQPAGYYRNRRGRPA